MVANCTHDGKKNGEPDARTLRLQQGHRAPETQTTISKVGSVSSLNRAQGTRSGPPVYAHCAQARQTDCRPPVITRRPPRSHWPLTPLCGQKKGVTQWWLNRAPQEDKTRARPPTDLATPVRRFKAWQRMTSNPTRVMPSILTSTRRRFCFVACVMADWRSMW